MERACAEQARKDAGKERCLAFRSKSPPVGETEGPFLLKEETITSAQPI